MTNAKFRRERKKYLQQLREQNLKLNHLLDNFPVISYSCRADSGYGLIWVSESLAEVTGYKPEVALKENAFWINRIHPEDLPGVLASSKEMSIIGTKTLEYRWKCTDGSYKWFHGVIKQVKDLEGNVLYLQGAMIDINEQKKAEMQLRDALNNLKKIVEKRSEELTRTNKELRDALSQVKTLKGFIPICANCGKIRTDEGFYQSIEAYIAEHTDAKFSHGICPDCRQKLYPQYSEDALKQ
jgi:PAS domain S-box-containing protein